MRVAVLWSNLSGYFNSCLKTLVDAHGVELFVSFQNESADAPYNPKQFAWIHSFYRYDGEPDGKKLAVMLEEFKPDALLVVSWHIKGYRDILKRFEERAVRILFMDNQWHGTLKQHIGAIASPWYIQPLYEGVFLPGERQAAFARKLGFRDSNIVRGGSSCDHPQFAAVWDERKRIAEPYPRSFIFVGRLVGTKGVQTLLDAYRKYRSIQKNPFDLICCGEGELRSELEGVEGIRVLGFIQPGDLPQKLLESSCLVLPSLFEPWALVIHEAVAAGMAVICTSACGAMVHLVQPGYNGYVVEPGNVDDLVRAMIRYSNLRPDEQRSMGEHSHNLSLQYTPELWASNLMSFIIDNRSKIG